MIFLRLLVGFLLIGCATRPIAPAPSTANVDAAVTGARSSNDTAQAHNDKARTLSQRIEDKAMVIDRFLDRSK